MNRSDTDRPELDATDAPAGEARHVIVAGYGLVGRTVTQHLERTGAAVTIIEMNERTTHKQASLHKRVIHGDVREVAVLRAAGIDAAQALVLAIPAEQQAVEACRVARQLNPSIYIAARTNFVSQGMLATEAGADHVVVQEIVTAEAMQRAVIERFAGQTETRSDEHT